MQKQTTQNIENKRKMAIDGNDAVDIHKWTGKSLSIFGLSSIDEYFFEEYFFRIGEKKMESRWPFVNKGG